MRRAFRAGAVALASCRESYRLGDLDFNAANCDGTGVDWPVSPAEAAPSYTKVEQVILISGRVEDLAHESGITQWMPSSPGEHLAIARGGRFLRSGA